MYISIMLMISNIARTFVIVHEVGVVFCIWNMCGCLLNRAGPLSTSNWQSLSYLFRMLHDGQQHAASAGNYMFNLHQRVHVFYARDFRRILRVLNQRKTFGQV